VGRRRARAVRSGSEAWAWCSRSLERKPEGRSRRGRRDPNRRQELAAKHEVTYSDEWVADLTSRYNLKLLGHEQDPRWVRSDWMVRNMPGLIAAMLMIE
jgi:hypothetical protein